MNCALTERQRELLDYINWFTAKHGHCPSFEEMREALGLSSKSGVHRLITGLEERGCIIRRKNRKRCIEVVEESTIARPVESLSDSELAAEAKQRGLVLGRIEKGWDHSKVKPERTRTFVPIAA